MLNNHVCVKRIKIRAKILFQEIFLRLSHVTYVPSKYFFYLTLIYLVNCKQKNCNLFFNFQKLIEYIKIFKSSLHFWAFTKKRQYIKKETLFNKKCDVISKKCS